MIRVFVGFSRIFLLGILVFKWLTARRLCKSFGVKGLIGSYALYETLLELSFEICQPENKTACINL
jgi:hypothetical protein